MTLLNPRGDLCANIGRIIIPQQFSRLCSQPTKQVHHLEQCPPHIVGIVAGVDPWQRRQRTRIGPMVYPLRRYDVPSPVQPFFARACHSIHLIRNLFPDSRIFIAAISRPRRRSAAILGGPTQKSSISCWNTRRDGGEGDATGTARVACRSRSARPSLSSSTRTFQRKPSPTSAQVGDAVRQPPAQVRVAVGQTDSPRHPFRSGIGEDEKINA